jgi:hypothetical protein
MTAFDFKLTGGKLEELFHNYHRIGGALQEATVALRSAEVAITDSEAADLTAEAQAMVAGDKPAEATLTADLKLARDTAAREVQVTQLALAQAKQAIHIELDDPVYLARLETAEAASTQAALNVVKKLETELANISNLRAHQRWLREPFDAQGGFSPVRPQSSFAAVEKARLPNGEFPLISTLTEAVREALEGTEPKFPAPWGLPVGSIKPEGAMTGGAARAFLDELPEATEAQTVLSKAKS